MGRRGRAGFTIVDAAGTLAALGVFAVLGAAGLGAARQASRSVECTARLGQIGAGNAQFALSFQGKMVGLTWQQGGANSQFPDLNAQQASSLVNAHAAQAVDILRRRGRPDMPVVQNWLPDVGYWSLALVDFENRALDDLFNVCPDHANLAQWRENSDTFDMGGFSPAQPTPTLINKRWPYTSSYTLTGSAFDVNQSVFTAQAPGARLSYGGTHNTYVIPGTSIVGPSAMSLVAFPSRKVHVFDSHQRHFPGLNLYYAYPEARQPILFFDSSVRVLTSADARTPWTPNSPAASNPQVVGYTPAPWEPPTQNGATGQNVLDRYRWTRDGLLGRDFK